MSCAKVSLLYALSVVKDHDIVLGDLPNNALLGPEATMKYQLCFLCSQALSIGALS